MRVRTITALLALVLCLFGGSTTTTSAQSLDDALAGFTTDEYSDTDKAITDLAASGNPRAVEIIDALQDGRLYFNADAKAFPPTISPRCGSTIACAARSTPRSAA
jgi:hypothetical protein